MGTLSWCELWSPSATARSLESLFSAQDPVLSTPCKSVPPLIWFGKLSLVGELELSFPKQTHMKAVIITVSPLASRIGEELYQ